MTPRRVLISTTLLALTLGAPTPARAATTHGSGDYCLLLTSTADLWCATTAAGLDAVAGEVLADDSIDSTRQVRLYADANKTGAYLDVYGLACDTDPDADDDTGLPGPWNDRVSSFQGYNNCDTKLYQNGDLTGATYGPTTATNYVGDTMNDQASSLRVY